MSYVTSINVRINETHVISLKLAFFLSLLSQHKFAMGIQSRQWVLIALPNSNSFVPLILCAYHLFNVRSNAIAGEAITSQEHQHVDRTKQTALALTWCWRCFVQGQVKPGNDQQRHTNLNVLSASMPTKNLCTSILVWSWNCGPTWETNLCHEFTSPCFAINSPTWSAVCCLWMRNNSWDNQ